MLKRMARRWRGLVRRADLDAQMDLELAEHLELETEKLVAQGLSRDAARTAALRAFGGVERVREEVRDVRGVSWRDATARNVRWSLRVLSHQRGYTLAVVATLGLGIGANTAVFSIIRGVLLKPLPYPQSEQLVVLRQSASLAAQQQVGVSIRELYEYREQLRSDFSALVEFHHMQFDLVNEGEPDRVETGVVSANFFETIGVRALIGRTFLPRDERHDADAVLVLGYAYWQSRFHGDPHVVGRHFQMNDRVHTVVGVLPNIPAYPSEVDVYMPTVACPFRAEGEKQAAASRRAFGALTVFGRLRPGVGIERARVDAAMVGARFAREHPDVYAPGLGFQTTVSGLLDELTRTARPMLLMLLGAVVIVLVLACANIASITLARTMHRDRELALRVALGAGRGQIAGLLLTESTVLALAGGAAGLAVAAAVDGGLAAFVGRFTSRTMDIAIDLPVLGFTLTLSLLTGLFFGALPALTTGRDPASSLKQAGATAGGPPRRRRVQQALVIAQVALSVVLLVGAGLLLSSVYRLQRVNPGFDTDRVLSAEVFGNFTHYKTPGDFLRLYEPLLERLGREPGVVSAAVASSVPLNATQNSINPFRIQGVTGADAARLPQADVTIASNGYFETLRVPLRRGRLFLGTDTRDAGPVAIISENAARFWNRRDPLGSRISFDDGATWMTVVGIIGNIRQFGLDQAPPAQIFLPLAQSPVGIGGRVFVRTLASPESMTRVVANAVHALDPALPVENVSTLDELRSRNLATPRLTALLLTTFAGVALVVTLAGLAGLMAMSVSQRTREFGLRLALGASPARLLTVVLTQAGLLVAAGLVLGIGSAAVLSTRALTAYLYDTQPTDPVTFAFVAVTLLVAGLAACVAPARRATRVDPMLTLRSE